MGERRYTRHIGAVIALASVIALSACSGIAAEAGAAGTASGAPTADGTQNTTPAPTETVPAPNGGSIDEVEKSGGKVETTKVGLKDEADVGGDVTARITKIRSLDVTAQTPGEISGPAVAVDVSLTNGGKKPIDIATAMVGLTADGDVFGQPTTSEPYTPFAGELAAGDTAEATYVFLLPEKSRKDFVVSIQYVAGATIALFAEEN
ncbi:hypothetical protein [Microbacterium sp.]|uniref:hypothetical protein n=1 Tax=Microbacterium sp. TaxID=51671 RepID=UPI0039E63788